MRVVCNHFGITLRPLSSTEAAHRTWICSGSMKMQNIATTTCQHIALGLSSRHNSPTTIRKHPFVRLPFPCPERYPCPMKVSKNIKQHSTWTHRSTVPWDFHHIFLHCSTSTTLSVTLPDNLHVLLVGDTSARSILPKQTTCSQFRRTVCAAQSDSRSWL